MAAAAAGTEPRVRVVGATMLRLAGLVDQGAREMIEMRYQFDRDFVVDSIRVRAPLRHGGDAARRQHRGHDGRLHRHSEHLTSYAGRVDTRVLADLASIVTPAHVITDAESKSGYEVDWTGRFRGATPAVVRPGTIDEVAAIVGLCRRESIAIVPQGGNTGMVGVGTPRRRAAGQPEAARCAGTGRRRRSPDRGGCGATVESVQRAAAEAGLRYTVDFGHAAPPPSAGRSARTPVASTSSGSAAHASSSSGSRRCWAAATWYAT